jgi:hypothetical protein
LQRVGGRAQDRGERLVGHNVEAALLLVHVHAVERDVGLVGARAADVAVARHAGLEREQADDVARVQGELHDAARLEGGADGGVGRVERRLDAAGDGDGLGREASFERHVHLDGRVNERLDFGDRRLLEARRLDLDAVGARRDGGEGVAAFVVGRLRPREVPARVGERHGGARDDVALLVAHRAAHGRAARLRERRRPGQQREGERPQRRRRHASSQRGLSFHRASL